MPKKFDVLAFTASYFDTIEINASFYAPQPPRNYASWARRVAHNDKFKFTAKLWRKFTHDVPTEWTPDDVRSVTEGIEVLREKDRLGALLAQFPWSFKPGKPGLDRLKRLAEDFKGWPVVVELRHGGWAHHEHAVMLKNLGLGFCNIDQPVIGDSLSPTAGATSEIGYVRFHGRRYDRWFEENEETAQRYDYLYTAEELEPWIERIRRIERADRVREVYVISNNHFEGKGPANALMIRAMLEGRKIKAPNVLYATYRGALEPWTEPSEGSAEHT